MNTVYFAKLAMRLKETHPDASGSEAYLLQEIFNHARFIEGDEETRQRLMSRSSQSKYLSELEYPWDRYFGFDLKPLLEGNTVLDLGCFTGGRSIAWMERYRLEKLVGIDVKDEFIVAANKFAIESDANAEFIKSTGEALPFDDESFDAILSFDVFEHVQSVAKTLEECKRVLRKNGKLFVVFPSYYQPVEHHLSLVTNTPGLHYAFSPETLIKAYCEILDERGNQASWYKRNSPVMEPWERGHTINGMTLSKFRRLIKNQGWSVHTAAHIPIGAIGRRVENSSIAKALAKAFYPLTFVPGLREVFLHRITFILEK